MEKTTTAATMESETKPTTCIYTRQSSPAMPDTLIGQATAILKSLGINQAPGENTRLLAAEMPAVIEDAIDAAGGVADATERLLRLALLIDWPHIATACREMQNAIDTLHQPEGLTS